MRICYLTRNYKTARHAGGKARQDMEELMRRHGYRNLGIPTTHCRNKVADFFLTLLGVLAYTLRLRRGDVVVLQYPVKKYFRYLCRLARMRGAKTVTLVHDLGSFRRHRLTPGEEVRKLSLTDALIISNEAEIGWLRDHGCRVPMTPQVAWDYLADSKPQHVPDPEEAVAHPSLMYVGNVRRKANGFLYKIQGLPMHLYGEGDVSPDDTHNIIRTHTGQRDNLQRNSLVCCGMVRQLAGLHGRFYRRIHTLLQHAQAVAVYALPSSCNNQQRIGHGPLCALRRDSPPCRYARGHSWAACRRHPGGICRDAAQCGASVCPDGRRALLQRRP